MQALTGYDIYDYLTAGAQNIIQYEDNLNAINVFPVADGDTGSNLAYTMKCILANAKRSEKAHETLNSISKAALEDAYGNSGTIFASFLYGLAIESQSKSQLTIGEFSRAAQKAVDYAYDALAKPQEGTILTVIKGWANYLSDHYDQHPNLMSLFSEAVLFSQKALVHTRSQLKVLADANVVDAGAQGFVYFLEGIVKFISGGLKTILVQPQSAVNHKHTLESLPTFQYCSEFIVEPFNTIDKKALMASLESLGDSVIVQKIGPYYKIHLHTNQPAKASEKIESQGKVIKSKVDDMLLQVKMNVHDKMPIGIITDSIADLSVEMKESLIVHHIPLNILLNGNTYTDRLTLNNNRLFQIIDQEKAIATTSQPSDTRIEKQLRYMLDHFENVIGLFVSSEMSGIYQKVSRVASDIDHQRLTIIDTKTNSVTEGLMVHTAFKMIEAGATYQTIIKHLQETINQYKIYVEIPDLHYATLSGRVPKIVGTLASWLKIKALITIDQNGKGAIMKERSLMRMVDTLSHRKNISKYAIIYTGILDDFSEEISLIQEKMGKPPVFINEVSGVISAFIGKGALSIGILEEPVD